MAMSSKEIRSIVREVLEKSKSSSYMMTEGYTVPSIETPEDLMAFVEEL